MKILHLSRSDSGGAGRAVYRIHQALRDVGVESVIWVNHVSSDDPNVLGPATNFEKISARIGPHLANALAKTLCTKNRVLHSPAILPSALVKRINQSDVDIVNLHWIGGEMLSIRDVQRIRKPVVWTLHDMWAFCGAEHVSFDFRWRDGYRHINRPVTESGFDLNRWTWNRKRKAWKRPMQIVTPSHWLGSCVRESRLMHNWPVAVIPNCLDTKVWRPVDSLFARELLGLPRDGRLLLFGANGIGANAAHHKGFDLLLSALEYGQRILKNVKLVVFGQSGPENKKYHGFPVHYLGYLHDNLSLRCLYSAVDALVVPSRSEAFCQTAAEAHACGTPVIAFNIGGLRDIVSHQYTGYLARPFDVQDLTAGIAWTLGKTFDGSPRERVIANFSGRVVAEQYRALYKSM